MVSKEGRKQSRICLICSHKIVLYNNDEDFSWDMHKQEENHKKCRIKNNKTITEKADTHMCIQRMKTFFRSNNNIEKLSYDLKVQADEEFKNVNRNQEVITAVARTFAKIYPGNFEIRPFGSRITGLTTKSSGDLDLFVDTSSEIHTITLVESPELESYYLQKLLDYMKKEESNVWVNITSVFKCRTPILKVLHYDTKLQCDITVRNGLGNVNTELVSIYINKIDKFRPLLLIIREWSSDCNYVKDINNYALSLLVLFYLQQENFAPAVFTFEYYYSKPRINISGYECLEYSKTEFDWESVKQTNNINIKQLLLGFFKFYSTFDFKNLVICPLLGKSLKKNVFTANGKKLPPEMHCYIDKLKNRGEIFNINNKGMNVQDPIDLAHNLTKSTNEILVADFMDMCDSTKRALEMMN